MYNVQLTIWMAASLQKLLIPDGTQMAQMAYFMCFSMVWHGTVWVTWLILSPVLNLAISWLYHLHILVYVIWVYPRSIRFSGFSNGTLLPGLYLWLCHFAFSMALFSLVVSCFFFLMHAQFAWNLIGGTRSTLHPITTNCQGIASSIIWYILLIAQAAALRNEPNRSYFGSSCFSSSKVYNKSPSTRCTHSIILFACGLYVVIGFDISLYLSHVCL